MQKEKKKKENIPGTKTFRTKIGGSVLPAKEIKASIALIRSQAVESVANHRSGRGMARCS